MVSQWPASTKTDQSKSPTIKVTEAEEEAQEGFKSLLTDRNTRSENRFKEVVLESEANEKTRYTALRQLELLQSKELVPLASKVARSQNDSLFLRLNAVAILKRAAKRGDLKAGEALKSVADHPILKKYAAGDC